MAGFGRDESKDSGGFRGVIPDNTTVPAVIIDGDASFVKMKRGDNAGKIARIYKPVFECVFGKFKGARVYSDVWCNVEPDPAGGEPNVFGSHMTFCDICDYADVKEDDGTYPIAATEEEAKRICQKFVGKTMLITVGTETYTKRDGNEGVKNTLKSVSEMTEEQKETVMDSVAATLERVAKQNAKKEVASGGSGLPDDDDDDTPF